MTTPIEKQTFDEWAIVDVMGHQRLVGRVTEHVIAGTGFVRVDVPATEKVAAWTKLIGTGSIYSITPVSEEIARSMVTRRNDTPVSAFELPKEMVASGNRNLEFQDDEDDYDPA